MFAVQDTSLSNGYTTDFCRLQADECGDKEKLFAHTSIAHWILPAIYMGHIGCLVWLRPPWSPQLPEGEHSLVVGRDCQSGHIRSVEM